MKRAFFSINRVLQFVEQCLAVVILVSLLLTMVLQVVARYVFHAAFSWSEELCRFGLVWLTFLAAAYIMAQRRHLGVDLWSHSVGKTLRRWADVFVHVVVAGTCVLLFVGSLRFVWYVHPVGSPAMGIPKSFWYGGVSVGLLLMTFHSVLNAWLALTDDPDTVDLEAPIEEGFRLTMAAPAPDAGCKSGVAP